MFKFVVRGLKICNSTLLFFYFTQLFTYCGLFKYHILCNKWRNSILNTVEVFYNDWMSVFWLFLVVLTSKIVSDLLWLIQYELRGVMCREAVNDCDIAETCTGDTSQVKKGIKLFRWIIYVLHHQKNVTFLNPLSNQSQCSWIYWSLSGFK